MGLTIYNREFWLQHQDRNPYLWSSCCWMVWEAMNQLETQGVKVISATMSRGYKVRVRTVQGERMIKVL